MNPRILFIAVIAWLAAAHAEPSVPTITVDADGTAHLPPTTLPWSRFASDAARETFLAKMQRITAARPVDSQPKPGADIATVRADTVTALTPWLDRAMARYPVDIVPQTLAGVRVDVVTPKGGPSAKQAHRVLINLHGGGFFVGAGIQGKLEAVPIASLGQIKVITIDYRQGPEFKFPAASEDVARVYAALLTQYKPANIGIYGCSAGGMLTAEVAAWLQTHNLPAPGAIGIFYASAGGWSGGDSTYYTSSFYGTKPPSEAGHAAVSNAAYFSDVDMKDPMVAPVGSPAVLAKFPPTLVLTATRDIAMSSAIFTHGRLVKLGVDAELHVWDGLDHGFFLNSDLPESQDAYAVIVKFFERHLGR